MPHLSNMAVAPATLFLRLPSELRFEVYHHTIQSTLPNAPTSYALNDCKGFLLSSKRIYAEFESEWATEFNYLLDGIKEAWPFDSPLVMPPVARLCASACIDIGCP